MLPLKQWRGPLYLLLFVLLVPILAACAGSAAPQVVRETVVVKETVPPVTVKETVVVEAPTAEAAPTTEAAAGAFTTPNPILGDVKVRQAIAYCTNRPELIKSVYPFLDDAEQKKLLMDTFVPQGHWALATEGLVSYPFDPDKGKALLDEAGWKAPEGGGTRANADGVPLFIKFVTTNAQFRQTWATVLEQQLADNCGIQIARTHAPASWLFGDTTGTARRDFELAAFAWVGTPEPASNSLYACNQIPLPSNNWEGQNAMGWCNEKASKALIAANNTLDREQRKKDFAIVEQEFTKDMVSLPLFQRFEAEAFSNNLSGLKSDPTEYMSASIGDWQLKDGDSVVIGFSQEPASLFTLVESAAVAVQARDLTAFRDWTSYNYDYQAVALKQLPTIENGGTKLSEVDVKAGDMVWTTSAEAVALAKDVEVVDSKGETVKYDGSSPLKMNQLAVTFQYVDGLKWEDGTPITKADWELTNKITCDKESGATTYQTCNSTQKVDITSDTEYTRTFLPGALDPTYFTLVIDPYGLYSANQVIQSDGPYKGKKLSEVPAKDWATLPEVAEHPLSNGPYKLVSWDKGQKMVFEANPNYFKGEPKVKKVTIQFVEDTNQAVAQLLTGDIDVLEKATLGAGAEVETVLKAAKEGKIQVVSGGSPTWEHMDMNLFLK
jgi:ABC-type transport system substrate-binding protein